MLEKKCCIVTGFKEREFKVLAIKEKNHIQRTVDRVPSPNLNLAIRNLLLKEITDDVLNEAPVLQDIALRLRKEVNIFSLRKKEVFNKVAGVDAGSQIIPLASRQYAVIGALAYRLPTGDRFFLPPESLVQIYSNSKNGLSLTVNIRREAKLFETALKFLETYPDTDLVLIDGPLAFSDWWRGAGEEIDRRRLIDSIDKLLIYCKDHEVLLAGIVKRSSARYLLHYVGFSCETELNDVSVLQRLLNHGERTDIFCPQDALRIASKNSYIMDAVGSPVYSFYARMSPEWNVPPIRIDLPLSSLGYLDEIADYCYATSYWEGIPFSIVKADEEVRVTRRFIADVYSEILTRVSRLNGEVSQLTPYWGEGGWMGV